MILLFTYFVINLYCAVITMSFATQRKKADALAKAEKARRMRNLTVNSVIARCAGEDGTLGAASQGNDMAAQMAQMAIKMKQNATIEKNPLADVGVQPSTSAAGSGSGAGNASDEAVESSMVSDARAMLAALDGQPEVELDTMSPEQMEQMFAEESAALPIAKEGPAIRVMGAYENTKYTEVFVEEVLDGETASMYRERRLHEGAWECSIWLWYRSDPEADPKHPNECSDPMLFDSVLGRLIASDAWDSFINLAIFGNIVFMAMEHHGQSQNFIDILKIAEVIFACIFFVEMLGKWVAYGGFKWYFGEPSNCFDFLLCTTSLPTVAAFVFGTGTGINLSMLRVFKLFRMFRLLRQMQDLIDTVVSSLLSISNLIVFIAFAMIIFGIFGTSLFALKLFDGDGEVPRNNFDNFVIALLTLFQIMTGEDWTDILYNTLRAYPKPNLHDGVIGSPVKPSEVRGIQDLVMSLFMMLTFFIFSNYVLLEMFTAVILENFELRADEKHNLQVTSYARVVCGSQ